MTKADVRKPPPKGWGEDALSAFLNLANANTFASFANRRTEFDLLRRIDAAFRDAVGCLINDPKVVPGFFLMRSHACFLGATRLALATEVFECFAVLRACLESALYGLFIARNPDKWKVWLDRNESEQSRRQMRDTFTASQMLTCLRSTDQKLHEPIKLLYERTIDFGGHPNPRGVLGSLEIGRNETHVKMETHYMTDDDTRIAHALKTTSQVGVGALGILEHAYSERFQISGLSDRIAQLSNGL